MTRINSTFVKTIKDGVEAKSVYFWDDILPNFGIRVQKKKKSYVVVYRNKYKKQRWYTLGHTNEITPEEARTLAKNVLGDVAKGLDPAELKKVDKRSLNVADLCEWYLKEGTTHKKPSTIKDDKSRIANHIKPVLGRKIVKEVKRGDIEHLLYCVKTGANIPSHKGEKRHGHFAQGGDGVSRRTLGLIGAIFEFAFSHGIIEFNPCRGIKRAPDNKRKVFLNLDEIQKLGEILNRPESRTLYKQGVDVLKLLLLTGCRRNEIASLRWEYIDFNNQCFHFPDTKTGKQDRPFGKSAKYLLQSINKGEQEGFVFPSTVGSGYYRGTNRVFDSIRKITDEEGKPIVKAGVRVHDLRHTFATIAADMGYSDLTIGGIIGHKGRTVTSRYTHTIDKSLILATNAVSARISDALEGIKKDENKIIDIDKLTA